jgi:hypothetical protein
MFRRELAVLIDISAENIYPFHNLHEDISDNHYLPTLATISPLIVVACLFTSFCKRIDICEYLKPVSAAFIHMLLIFIVQCLKSLDPEVDSAIQRGRKKSLIRVSELGFSKCGDCRSQ